MESSKNLLIEEEEANIFSHSNNSSNFGVQCKNFSKSKNLQMCFTPRSSNNEASFSNTIMLQFVTLEASLDNEKNIEKSKFTQKDSTRLKTESSKDEKNNISKLKEENGLEINPFFVDVKFGLNNKNDNNYISEIEEKKVNEILTKKNNNELKLKINTNTLLLNSNKNTDNKPILKKEKRVGQRTQTTKSLIINNSKNCSFLNKGNPGQVKKTVRHNTCIFKKSKILPEKNILNEFKPLKDKPTRKRQFTVYNKSSNLRKKENNSNLKSTKINNLYKYGSSKLKIPKLFFSDKKAENSAEKSNKNKNKKKKLLLYNEVSRNDLKVLNNIDNDENKSHKKDRKKNPYVKAKTKSLSVNNIVNNYKRTKTFTSEINISSEKKNKTSHKKRNAKSKKKENFISFLKNKNNLYNTQFNLFSPDKFTNTQFCGSDFCEYTLDCMDLILNPNKTPKQVKPKVNFNFPKSKKKINKKIALFDLDETLVHCTGEINANKEIKFQEKIKVSLPGNKEVEVGINIRPQWKKTLNLIKKYYHIVVFTASHQAYADAVLDHMDPGKKYFKYRLYRNNCSLVDVDGVKFYVKDLDIFDEFYDLKDIVIIDNSVLSFIYHLENGIPIVPYYNEDKDDALYVVGLYLIHIYNEDDLRISNKKNINLESFLNEAKLRKEQNSVQNTINEESFTSVGNDNDEEEEEDDDPIISKSIKSGDNNKNEENELKSDSKLNSKRSSAIIQKKLSQKKLISNSKLIHVYYELNDQNNNNNNINDRIKNELNQSDDKQESESDDQAKICFNKGFITN